MPSTHQEQRGEFPEAAEPNLSIYQQLVNS